MSGTVSPLEVTWTVIAGIGLLFSLWLTFGGWMDFQVIRKAIRAVPPRARIWGPRWWVALSAVVANGLLCFIWVGFVAIGFIAMQFPPPPPNVEQSVSNVWAGWVLIVMEGVLAFVQAWHLFVRSRVEQAVRWRPDVETEVESL